MDGDFDERRAKPPLILLHGAIGGAEQLAPLAELLRRDGFDVHLPELPGHGDRPLGGMPFALPTFVEDLGGYVEARGLRRPVLFGHSMGGLVGLLLALERPEHLGAVATLGTKLLWTPEIAEREVGYLLDDKIEEKVPKLARTLAARHRALGWWLLLEHTRSLTLGLGRRPPLPLERLGDVSVPVSYGVASRDHLVPREEGERAVEHLAQGELWTPEGSHALESIDADALAGHIRLVAEDVVGAAGRAREFADRLRAKYPGREFVDSTEIVREDRDARSSASTLGTNRSPKSRTSTSPGEVLLEEFLKPLGLSAYELAGQVGMPPAEVERVVWGERPVDGEVAERLSRRFGTTEAFWLGLQDAQDLTRERGEEAKPEAGREGKPGDEDPILSLPDDPLDDEALPADASTNLDRYLYGDGEPFGDGARK